MNLHRPAAGLGLVLLGTVTACHPQESPQPPQQQPPRSAADQLRLQWSRGMATGEGPVGLTTFPLRVEDIAAIRPMGLMASGHVTPSDHLYIIPREAPETDHSYDILAVADGYVVMVQWRPNNNPDPTVFARAVDLKVFVEHSASCWSYVDHLDSLDPAIAAAVGPDLAPGRPFNVRVPVKAGQVIGHVHRIFDFALIDTNVTRTGFVRPEQFLARDPWKLHTVDPFDYLDEPLRSSLLALDTRKVPPFGGRMDYDIDGRLVGNWFLANSGGYAGLNRRPDYWVGHLTFAYHYVNPTQIIVSIGDWQGQARQFQVRGNAPDPAEVSQDTGLVKYELVMPQISEQTGQPYPDLHERYVGSMLVQLTAPRTIKVELFPDRTAADVEGFSPAARIYER